MDKPISEFSYKSEVKRIVKMAVPMFITQMTLVSISIVNTKIVANLGASAIAALGLSTSVLTMISAFTYTLLSPISNFIAQAIGERNEKKIFENVHQGLYVAIFLCFVFCPIVYFSRYTVIPLAYLIDEHFNETVANYMEIYLKGIAFLFPSYFITIVLRGYLEAHQKIYVTMNATVFAFIFNIVVCNLLTYGVEGYFEGLGILGASLSIALSYTVRFVILFLYVQKKKIYQTPVFSHLSFSFSIIKRIFYVGLPLAITFAIETAVLTGVSYAVIPFGIYVIGATQIMQSVWQGFYQVPFGLNFIIGLRVSYYIGEKRFEDVKKLVFLALKISFITGTTLSLITFLGRDYIAHFFTTDVNIITHLQSLLIILALLLIPDTFQSVFASIQKAHSDTVFPMIAYLGSYAVFMPGAYFFTYGLFGFPAIGPKALYLGFIVSLTSVCIVLFFRHLYVRKRYTDENFMKRFSDDRKYVIPEK